MDIVLEMAHKVDDTGNNNIPSRELVQEKIIFNCGDILTMYLEKTTDLLQEI
jgi:hypothetical protein